MIDNEVRIQSGKTLQETMKDFIDSDIDEEENYIYTGIVVNNNDPDKQGKCKIRVYSIFGNDVPDEHLPWALPDFTFVGSSVGNFVVPPVGALVNVYFDRGDIYLPHYTTKVVNKNSLPKRRMKNYPNNIVLFETDNGDYFEIDRNNSTAQFYHKSGTSIKILSDGSIVVDCKGNILSMKNADFCEIFGKNGTNLGGSFPVIYSTNGLAPVDAEGRPIQNIAFSTTVTVGK